MAETQNPFFQRSTLPAELPPFADIRPDHYAPAFARGIADQLAEVAAIADSTAPPTFDNTIVELERSGRILARVAAVFFTLSSADAQPWVTELDTKLAPQLAAHSDAIRLNGRLFARIAAVYGARAGLQPEQRHLVERYHIEYTLAGAGLGDAEKAELSAMNSRIALLTTRFDANLTADSNARAVHVTDEAELDGLSPGEISAAAQAAADRGLDGWLITLVLPSGHPWLASITSRALRERIMTASLGRGATEGEHDNRPILLEIVRLRARRAALLGFPSQAALVAADETAETPEAVSALLDQLAPRAARNAEAEAARLEVRMRAAGVDGPVRAWDWAYFSEQERSAAYDVDAGALRPYLEAERVLRDGVFWAAQQLYGISFEERPDLAGYHPEVRVFEVRDRGGMLGLYLLDLYTRDTKRGGAWMQSLVDQSVLLESRYPVVVNNLNVPKPAEGEPTLLTLDLAETLFHEFGHALHGLFASVGYPKHGGTAVPRDFVEFPSQVNEMWLLHPEVLGHFARHIETGAPIPQDLVDRLLAARQWGEGFGTTEYLAATLLDQAWHRLTPAEADAITDVAAFEAHALAQVGLAIPAIPPRYSSAYFAHVFASDGGYEAAYYAYIWSEVLDADTVAWFEEHGGLTRENGDRFRRLLLGVGGSKDPLEAYRDFRGRAASIEPLLERRGLTA